MTTNMFALLCAVNAVVWFWVAWMSADAFTTRLGFIAAALSAIAAILSVVGTGRLTG